MKRVAGCSYPDIMVILQDRYGQPATVGASCIESLTSGPKLTNGDYKDCVTLPNNIGHR